MEYGAPLPPRLVAEWHLGTHRRPLGGLVRQAEGRDPDASAGIVDARSVRVAATVTSPTKGYDAGKKIKGRRTFGVVDTLGLLVAVVVVAVSVSDNTGGIAVVDRAHPKSRRLGHIWCDAGLKTTFRQHCRRRRFDVAVINKINPAGFRVLPRRRVVERTWA